MGDAASSNDTASASNRNFVLGATSPTNSDTSIKVSSVLDAKTTLSGKLTIGSPTRIDGTFEGEIEASAPLEIGPTADVRGRIVGPYVLINGKFEGAIEVSERLVLARKAVVRADVTTQSISIEEGVVFIGKCTMPHQS